MCAITESRNPLVEYASYKTYDSNNQSDRHSSINVRTANDAKREKEPVNVRYETAAEKTDGRDQGSYDNHAPVAESFR